MNTLNVAQQTNLTNSALVHRIDDLINLSNLAGNSLSLDAVDPAAEYALKQMDIKLADLMNYFSEQATAETTEKSPAPVDYLSLTDTGNDAYMKADALLHAVIANKEGEGFYALSHQLSHSYIASISAEVERLKVTIDSFEKLAREC